METAVYVLLGALAMALVALLALPAISRRAFRLAEARARLLAPLSAAEARAERDALRGRHAVETALIERQAAEARDQWAAAQIALGRQSADLVRRDADLAARAEEIEGQREEISALERALRERDAEIGARETAMLDLAGQRDAAQRRAAEAAARAESERSAAAKIEAARADLETRLADLARDLSETLRLSDVAIADANGKIAALERRLAEPAAIPAPPPEREEELRVRIAALAAAQDEAQAALRVARADRDLATRELATLRLQSAAGETDARLREAIVKLGREIVESRTAKANDRERASSLAPLP